MNLTWPVGPNTPISQRFGENSLDYRRFNLKGHNGLDFAASLGSPVYAAGDGTIDRISTDPAGYGLYIRVKHSWGISLYGHLSKVLLQQGDKVSAGQSIALTGNSGNSTGPHLHFEIRPDSEPKTNGYNGAVDPLPFLVSPQIPVNIALTNQLARVVLGVNIRREANTRSIVLGYLPPGIDYPGLQNPTSQQQYLGSAQFGRGFVVCLVL